jgi:ribosomal-protein-alanine N-acetyltransferase
MPGASDLRLTPADPALAEWWHGTRQETETLRYNPLLPMTVEQVRERLMRSSSDLRADYDRIDDFFWAARLGDELLGHVTLQNINRTMGTGEIGYGIAERARGRGLGTEVVRRLARMAFAESPLRKLVAFVHAENVASRRALEKAGFVQEGLLREHFVVNGVPADEAIYGLLRADL